MIKRDNQNPVSFFAKEESLTLECQAKLFLKDNMLLLIGLAVFFSFGTYKIRSWMYNRHIQGLSRDLYQSLKQDLQGVGQSVKGLSEKDMLQKFLRLPTTSGDRIKRDESTFSALIMPTLE